MFFHIQVLGTPTREEIRCMNPNYTDFRFPQIKAHPWHKVWLFGKNLHVLQFGIFLFWIYSQLLANDMRLPVCFLTQIFHKRMPPEAIDLASRLLQYSPSLRCTAVSPLFSLLTLLSQKFPNLSDWFPTHSQNLSIRVNSRYWKTCLL